MAARERPLPVAHGRGRQPLCRSAGGAQLAGDALRDRQRAAGGAGAPGAAAARRGGRLVRLRTLRDGPAARCTAGLQPGPMRDLVEPGAVAAAGHGGGRRGAARPGVLAGLSARRRAAGAGPLLQPRADGRHAAGTAVARRRVLVGTDRCAAVAGAAVCRVGRADLAWRAGLPGDAAGRAAHGVRLSRARHARAAHCGHADAVAGGTGRGRYRRAHHLPVRPRRRASVGRGLARERAGPAGLAGALWRALVRPRPQGQRRHGLARTVGTPAGLAAGRGGRGGAGAAAVRIVVVAGAVGALEWPRAGRLAGVWHRLHRAGAGNPDGGGTGAGAGCRPLYRVPEPVHAAALLRGASHARLPGRVQRRALCRTRSRSGGGPAPARALQRGRARARRPAQPQRLL